MIVGMNYTTTATINDFTGGYKKITISIPDYLYRQVKKLTKPGEVSRFFADAILNRISSLVLTKTNDPVEEFLALRDELPKFSRNEILEAIHRDRK